MKLKKLNPGIILVTILFVFNAFVVFTSSFGEFEWMTHVVQWHGINILLSLMVVFLLNTRNQTIYHFFGGMNNAKLTQRFLTILSLVFVYVHVLFSYVIRSNIFLESSFDITTLFGHLTYLLLGLLILFLLIQASYQTKKLFLHASMMVVFGVGTYHAVVTSYDSLMSFSLLSNWVFGIVGVGFLAMMISLLKLIASGLRDLNYKKRINNKPSTTSQI